MSKIISDFELIEKLKETIEGSDWDQLSAVAEHLFGGRFTYDAEIDGAVLTPDEEYSGAFGEIEWEIEASFYDMDTDPGTPYAQKSFTVMAGNIDEALDKAKEMAYFDDEAQRSDSCSVEVKMAGA